MARKLTQEEFINQCKTFLGDNFTYDKTIYVNNRTKVTITDKNGNDIIIYPSNIKKFKFKNKKYTTNSFIERSNHLYRNYYIYDKCVCNNSCDKIIITCPKHGDFIKAAQAHLNGQGCPICGNRINNDKFIEKARQIHGNKYDYSKINYINNHTKVCIICPEHGEFLKSPSSHLKGEGCPICSKIEKQENNKRCFFEQAKIVHHDKYIYSNSIYKDSNSKISIICPEHGEFWQSPSHHLRGQGCPMCGKHNISKNLRLSQKNVIERAIKIHGNKYDYSKVKYEKWDEKVEIICPTHGVFLQTMQCHIGQGHGCPKCHSSHAEREIESILRANNIKYESQKSFQWLKMKNPLFIDFYLTDFAIAIEFQGGQHFMPVKRSINDNENAEKNLKITQERDKQKFSLCKKHGIKLYYIIPKEYHKTLCYFYDKERVFSNINDLLNHILNQEKKK